MIKLRLPDGVAIVIPSLHELNTLEEIWFMKPYDQFDIRPGWTVIDVGAHIGIFTLKAAKKVGKAGKVVAVEPHPENLKYLEFNIRINNLRNIILVNSALLDKMGPVKLHIGSYSAHYTINPNLNPEGRYSDFIEIQCTTLDKLIYDLGLEHVDLVKIDVEGAELAVLKGAEQVLDRLKRFTIAAYHYPKEFKEISDYLFDRGFKPHIIRITHTPTLLQKFLMHPNLCLKIEAIKRLIRFRGSPHLSLPLTRFIYYRLMPTSLIRPAPYIVAECLESL